MSTVTAIKSCATTACAYNHGGCTAFAITVGGDSTDPACSTFVSLDARGGLPVAEGHVGACQRLECIHNTDLMCTADGSAHRRVHRPGSATGADRRLGHLEPGCAAAVRPHERGSFPEAGGSGWCRRPRVATAGE